MERKGEEGGGEDREPCRCKRFWNGPVAHKNNGILSDCVMDYNLAPPTNTLSMGKADLNFSPELFLTILNKPKKNLMVSY